ncbi:response regulator [Mangrovibacterium sp.]|uniref:response regulator n=1 Tax=Mangrovibacterium sp. TaxID=1961364 RepID=UPI0035655BB0
MSLEKEICQSGLKVVIAEDENYNYLYLAAILRKFKIEIIRAYNGKMAVDLCKTQPDIGLVLMDVGMPVMDGMEATRQIKTLRPNLPIIMQTAFSDLTGREISLECGCDCVLFKPITKNDLISSIEKYVPVELVLEKA